MPPCAATSSEHPEPVDPHVSGRGRFITLEGIEGAGKSSQIEPLRRALMRLGVPVLTTREPGGSPVGEQIRGVLLDRSNAGMSAMAELLLVFAARAEHLDKLIRPALERGTWVLCDRFTDATYAYQGGGRRMDPRPISLLEELVQRDLRPDLTLIFDLEPGLGLQRARGREPPDRFESEHLAFFEGVRAVYLERARNFPRRYRVLDAALPLESVTVEATRFIRELVAEDRDLRGLR